MATETSLFEGQVLIVTGAGRGLGRAYAIEAARRGARLIVNDPGSAPDGRGVSNAVADAVVDEIRAFGGDAIASYDSVAEPSSAARIVDMAMDAFGTVDAVINNAGNAYSGAFEASPLDEMRNVIETHLIGTIAVTQAAWPIMKAKGYGRVVMTVSTAGLFGIEQLAGYAAAKGGIFGLMKCLAREGEPFGIRVNAISPGAQTRLGGSMFQPGQVSRRWRPELVAPPVLYLASEQCEVTGYILSAMAGRYARAEIVENQGAKLDPRHDISYEDVVAQLPKILDLTGANALTHGFAEQIVGSATR
ncbi:SDR family NAD(P)-dependent oxidoreductase [Rhizorhabdus wittichii]|uniref:SDR family NAD(P)-dependent oxidoreductase n=1 Tax=Rhizorhabdus wittichii TaxID=160791 RepID=UPI00037A692A|nr:SDR family NAD(P)-dependent oxidoreductase [Rhizorhabdus wittichii]